MPTERWLTEREQAMWRGFVQMRRVLDQVIEAQLAEHGLSTADYALLVPLSEAPDGVLRPRDLGHVTGWDRSRLAHQLRRMDQRGLVRRFDCLTDARGTMVHITPAGRQAIDAAAPGHVETVRRHLVDLLTPAEIETLTTIAARVVSTAAASSCETEEASEPPIGKPPGR
ncbi:MAG: MarR family winged helix-turn-helix transcriptional regulator [Actinomycetota bacterium]|nr:MarR family winged helix-turn-helix transcriptional regulator [Actinomycetota bacterium]